VDNASATIDRSADVSEQQPVGSTRPVGVHGVLDAHILHIRGPLPTWEIADLLTERLGQVLGRERVLASNRLDPGAPRPSEFPIYARGGAGAFDPGNARMGADLTSVLDLVHRLLAVYSTVEVSLSGYLTGIADDESGARLRRERRLAVTSYLEFKRVDLRRVHGLEDDDGRELPRIELVVRHLLD
jgi:hypothetical protein